MFDLRGVFFDRYVQLKSSFSDKKKDQRENLGLLLTFIVCSVDLRSHLL